MGMQLTPEQIAERNSAALADICCLYNEMDAVVKTLDDYMDDLYSGERDQKELLNRSKGLTMALCRMIHEVGREAGAV